MSDIAIKVEGLGKQYRLGEIGTGTISHDLNRWWAQLRGKEDPFAKVGEANDRTAKGNSDYVWSLRDIDFEVKKGEVLGIIGRNGAGKSTLLKILSKVTAPTTGNIKVNGRIASLLEVGTGFHPELTGRENIFLNGAILGMTKTEIRSKFDEIVDFSGVERYIDTPVKRYSSGMYVRLAFAVAAFLEPEILIVDEVLAVGDAEFQKKCIGRMKDVSVNDGRTVLFVSHHMPAIKQLCTHGIILKKGGVEFDGSIPDAIQRYAFNENVENVSLLSLIKRTHPFLSVNDVFINGEIYSPISLKNGHISIVFKGRANHRVTFAFEIKVYTGENVLVSFYSSNHENGQLIEIQEGENFVISEDISMPMYLPNGDYYASIALTFPNVESYVELLDVNFTKEDFISNTGKAYNYNEIGFFPLIKQSNHK
ncbi:MAG: ABC transporter ATP-binding protein [Sphingobacteriaceae bacterium]|nr:MAG: ABC transporter ATP-binding protein [Sphingobacteriaceae bacterium]